MIVTGASGLVGRALCDALESPVALVRRAPRTDRERRWDPARGELDPEAIAGAAAVVHLAGESIAARRWTTARKRRLVDSRVQGTELLARTIAELGDRAPRAFLCASAIGIYGHREGDTWLDAGTLPGSGFLADLCRRWEAAAEPARAAGVPTTHLRFGVVLAPRGGALAKMLLPFRLGLGGRIGNGRQYLSWIALEDVVRAILHVLEHGLSGPIDVVAPHPVTNADFTATLGEVVRRPTPFPMPKKVARIVFGELADELLLASQRVRPTALLRDGFEFRRPELEDALRAILDRPAPPAETPRRSAAE